jgi:hypothetical protein
MTDQFDRHLKAALAPPERSPDRKFVLRVQAAIALEERLAGQRASLLRGLGKQIIAVGAVAAGIWWVSRAAPVSAWLAQSPAAALAILLTGFAFLVAILGRRPDAGALPPPLIKLNGS